MRLTEDLAESGIALEDQYFDLQGLSKYCALGRTTLRDYIKKGSLPGYKVGGKTLVKKSEFDQWMGKFRIKEHDVDADVGELLSRVRKAKSSKRI